MSFPDVTNAVSHWAFLPTLVRLALALGTGAFVGLEREHRGKGGVRTFTFASLIGCLGGLLGNSYGLLAIILIGLFVCFLNFREWRLHQNLLLSSADHCWIRRSSLWQWPCLYSCRHRSDNGCLTGLEATNYWICDRS
jgi:hypothetical protein